MRSAVNVSNRSLIDIDQKPAFDRYRSKYKSSPGRKILTLGLGFACAFMSACTAVKAQAERYVFRPTGRIVAHNVKQSGHVFVTQYETKHLVLYSDGGDNQAAVEAESLEGFASFVERYIFALRGAYPIKVYALQNEPAMQNFITTLFEGEPAPKAYGVFTPTKNAFITYEGTGYGTWTHEFMHKVLFGIDNNVDPWASEGIPTVFEKVFGYPSSTGWRFVYGFQNPWRLKELDRAWDRLTLSSIVNDGNMHDQSRQRLVGTFLNDNGKLRRYLELAAAHDKRGYGTYLEAAFGKSLSELEPLFERYIAVIRANWQIETRIPSARYFFSEEAFRQFVARYPYLLNPPR